MTQTERSFTIAEAAALTGVSTHTLRFYEQQGLFLDPVLRNTAGRRTYTEKDVEWIRTGLRLRATGMPLPVIRRFAQLARAGASGDAERLQLLQQHEEQVRVQLDALHEILTVLESKISQLSAARSPHAIDRPVSFVP